MIKKVNLYAALAGLALCAAQMASADTHVTFQVDMTSEVGVDFNPPTDKVYAFGSLNNWSGGLLLTNNPAAANTNIYSGTTDDTADANGAVMDWKYVINQNNFENTQDGNNRCITLPTTSGSSVTVDLAYFADNHENVATGVANNVTFQVDMAQQIQLGRFVPGTSHVYAQGGYEGWNDGGAELFNDPTIFRTNANNVVTSNVYTGTFSVFSAPGGTEDYKFVMNTGSGDQYEAPTTGDPDQAPGGNRFFDGQTTNFVLPIVFFSDAPFNPVETNLVTFQVDLTAQVLNGSFNPSVSQVNVNGAFNNFTANVNVLTNNPSAANTNIYSGQVSFVDGLGAAEQYKFTTSTIGQANSSYESLAASTPQAGGNRFFNMVSGSTLVLPVVFFSDTAPILSDYLTNSVTVTFTVNMTNAVGTDSTIWDPTVGVYINGDFIGWPAFNTSLPLLTETDPGTGGIYTFTTNFPAGKPVVVNYQYSLNGAADESSTFGANHVRYIRSYGTYNFPLDTFGTMTVEPSFGNLSVGKPAGGHVPVSWLGRPGVQLQTSSKVNGPWTNVIGTDAMSATNVAAGGASQYFRLVHPLH